MNESFSIREESTREAVRIFRLSGRLDARAAAALASRCKEVCVPGQKLVLTLREVEFLSSSGIGTLLALAEEFRESEASLLLAAPSEAVSIAIGLLNLGDFISLYETEQDAISRSAA